MKKEILIFFFTLSAAYMVAQEPLKKTKIAFLSKITEKNSEIYIIDSDGSNEKRITFNDWKDGLPSWSPDGKRIAFLSCRDTCGIYIMNVDGSNIQQLTNGGECMFKWSPDGKWVAYEDAMVYDAQLYLITPDKKDFRQLTHNNKRNINVTWSPDSRHVAFTSDRDGDRDRKYSTARDYEIYVMNIDSPDFAKRITFNDIPDKFPAWSPNGKFIAYVSYLEKSSAIWIMDTDGGNARKLIENGDLPTWSPDSKKIAFEYDTKGKADIYTIDIDGKNLKCLTKNIFSNYQPSWSPYIDE